MWPMGLLFILKDIKNSKKVGAEDRKIAGTTDSKHSPFKCLVNALYILVAQMTPRFLTKVNTYIFGSKH